jgi:hypothetical protein
MQACRLSDSTATACSIFFLILTLTLTYARSSQTLPLSQTPYPAPLKVQLPQPEILNTEAQPRLLRDPVTHEISGAEPVSTTLQVDELPPAIGRTIAKRRHVVPEDQWNTRPSELVVDAVKQRVQEIVIY